MTLKFLPVNRRTVLKAGAALGASTMFSPPILTFAQGETPIKIGMHDPFTGTYAAEGESESARRARWRSTKSTPRAASSAARSSWSIEDDSGQRRPCRAESAQADRAGQGRPADGRRVVGDRAVGQPGRAREGHALHGHRRPHRSGHRHAVPLDHVPHLHDDLHARGRSRRRRCTRSSAASGTSSRRIMPTAIRCRRPTPSS